MRTTKAEKEAIQWGEESERFSDLCYERLQELHLYGILLEQMQQFLIEESARGQGSEALEAFAASFKLVIKRFRARLDALNSNHNALIRYKDNEVTCWRQAAGKKDERRVHP